MWRMITYPLAAVTVLEAIIVLMFREAYVWLGIIPEHWGAMGVMLVAGVAALVVGTPIGYYAADEADTQAKRAADLKRVQIDSNQKIEALRIEAESEKVRKMEQMIGMADPDVIDIKTPTKKEKA